MRLVVDQVVNAPADDVLGALTDPAYYASLARLARVDAPELLERHVEGDTVTMQVRYRFRGQLAPPVRAVVDPERLVWVVELEYDLGRRCGRFRIVPEHYGDRLRCEGVERLEPDGERTHRVVEADLQVKAPVVGRAVERGIALGFREHLAEEAGWLEAWLGGR